MIALDRDPAAPGFRYADRRAIVSAEDEPGIERLSGAERVDGVIAPGIDWPVAIAARIAERLGLPHPLDRPRPRGAVDLEAAAARAVRRGGSASARVRDLLRRRGGDRRPRQRIGFPCVIKAPDRQGQRGLTLVRSSDEVAAGGARSRSTPRASATLLVEEHVAGREVTVNAFSSGGHFDPLTVTDRLTAPLPAFGVALTHVWPSELAPAEIGAVVEAAAAAAAAVGIADGTELHAGRSSVPTGRASASSQHDSAAATMRSSAASRSASI